MSTRSVALALAAAGALSALPAASETRVVPAEPYAFEPVNLRMDVDSCAFAPETVSVSSSSGVFRVIHRPNQCLLPGEPRVADILLGSLPAGTYEVQVFPTADAFTPIVTGIRFTVRERPEIAVFPRPARPLTDYSGMWYRPAESGWGLSFHQSSTRAVFAAWYVYDAADNPTWYTIESGQWTSATQWSGTVYRTSGPPLFAPVFDLVHVTRQPVGQASLDFTQRPSEEGWATFTYTVGGSQGTKRITRHAF
ncbi:MAG: hypothetical protein FIB05_14770 [Betaproteobacteria bacterium]|nr:hypothetical protein [Betaproteobacteria bacterium]